MTPFNTMPLVAVNPNIGASTFFEEENAILGGFETTQIDGGMPYPRLEDVNAPNDSGITGYDGTAFINMAYSDQATVTWNNVSVSQAGNYTVSWRYSQAPGVFDLPDRPVGLILNGQVITPAVSFPELNSWNTWAMNPAITLHLNAGVNSIELFADNTITPGANPHIDSMRITSTTGPLTTFPPPPTIGSDLNTIEDPGFESVTPAELETGTPSPWTFTAGPLLGSTMSAAGVAGNVGYFTSGNPHAPEGTQVAFVQGAGSSFSQSINFSAGIYSLTFQAAQRGVSGGETFNVLVDSQVVGSFRPSGTSYSTFTTGNFVLSAGSHTIEFLGSGSAGGKETALIDNVRLNTVVGAADHFAVSAPAGATAGTPFSVTVTVQDAYNHTVTGYTGTVHFRSADPYGANLPADYTFRAADQGQHTFAAGAALYMAGAWDVTAADTGGGIAGTTYLSIVAAAADHLVFQQPPTDTGAGQTISPAVTVAIVDRYGNVETGDNSDSVTLSLGNNPGGGTLSGTLTLMVVNGVAAFGDLSIDMPGIGYTLHVSIGGAVPDMDSDPFTITM
jgi:hypothetical protein